MMPLGLSAYLERPVNPNTDRLKFDSNIHSDSLIFTSILSYLPVVSSLQDFDSINP